MIVFLKNALKNKATVLILIKTFCFEHILTRQITDLNKNPN